MLGACGLTVVALVGCGLSPSALTLGLSIFVVGLAAAVWGLARQSYLTEAVPVSRRARALSTSVASSGSAASGVPSSGRW